MKQRVKRGIFLAVGLGIIVAILAEADLETLGSILAQTDPRFLGLGIALSLIQPVLATSRWHLLLRHKGIEVPFWRLVSTYMIGFSISSFLPSKYSGDVYKTYTVAKDSGRVYDSVASVLLYRLSGFFVMCVLGVLAAAVGLALFDERGMTLTILAISLALVIATYTVFSQGAFHVLETLLRLLRLDMLRRPAEKLHTAVLEYRGETRLVVKLLWLALLFYLEAYVIVFAAVQAVGAEVSFAYVVLVVPMIYLLEALPVSVSGLGVREGAFVFFFTKPGLGWERAVAISLVVLFFRLVKALVGGALFLVRYVAIRKVRAMERRPVAVPEGSRG
ncbi:MAG: flippase-like domain-containing protein [Candidatus Omnitrophica bacterium]|nr:flippase-like domain-containing protein [Candidatus Omnitrophota bacterium]